MKINNPIRPYIRRPPIDLINLLKGALYEYIAQLKEDYTLTTFTKAVFYLYFNFIKRLVFFIFLMFKDALDRLNKKIEDLESTKPYDDDLCHKYLYILAHFTLFFIEILVLVSILYFTSMSILLILSKLWIWFSKKHSYLDGFNPNYNKNNNPINNYNNNYDEEEKNNSNIKGEKRWNNFKNTPKAYKQNIYNYRGILLSKDGVKDTKVRFKNIFDGLEDSIEKHDHSIKVGERFVKGVGTSARNDKPFNPIKAAKKGINSVVGGALADKFLYEKSQKSNTYKAIKEVSSTTLAEKDAVYNRMFNDLNWPKLL